MPEDLRNTEPGIPWRNIIGMRHILVHNYFGIDLDAVWHVVSKELPAVRQAITGLLERLQLNKED